MGTGDIIKVKTTLGKPDNLITVCLAEQLCYKPTVL